MPVRELLAVVLVQDVPEARSDEKASEYQNEHALDYTSTRIHIATMPSDLP